MLCQNCKKREVTTHYHSVINGIVIDEYLCSECAAKQSNEHFENNNIFKMLTNIFTDSAKSNAKLKKCECCGADFDEICVVGRVGCGNCYKAFNNLLTPTLQRLHGNAVHIGKRPDSVAENNHNLSEKSKNIDELQEKINCLKSELSKAIETENYEKAAEIRDLLKQMEA